MKDTFLASEETIKKINEWANETLGDMMKIIGTYGGIQIVESEGCPVDTAYICTARDITKIDFHSVASKGRPRKRCRSHKAKVALRKARRG